MHPFALEYPTGNGKSEMRPKKNLARVWKKVELIKVFTLQYDCNSNMHFRSTKAQWWWYENCFLDQFNM